MQQKINTYLLLIGLMFLSVSVYAQEGVAPLGYQPMPERTANPMSAVLKTTALTLPFFDDFAYASKLPDSNKWADKKVYINNTMCIDPVTAGVATFDALDSTGIPYNTVDRNALRYSDSLTCRPIDLSGYQPSDSLYISFFYQAGGNGFYPDATDSLALLLRKSNGWAYVWSAAGGSNTAFKQVMIPVRDAAYFHAGFQFRFVNKASINNTDDNWHIDYVRFDANRNINDTIIKDVAFKTNPTSMLKNYTFMPYHQYLANAANERAAQQDVTIRNNDVVTNSVDYGYVAEEQYTNTPLSTSGVQSTSINANSDQTVSTSVYSNTITGTQKNLPVYYENKYYLQSAGSGSLQNDTIRQIQMFHNYYAYDDGSAEKSYYLKLSSTLPGKIAIEYSLNEPDTLNGIAIYFGRQVPLAYQKFFSAAVYGNIAYNGGSDDLLYQEDFLTPQYLQVNDFWIYKFQRPVALPAGTFYIGTVQPALGSSDSLYFGLDVNRVGGNHAYYDVVGYWQSSSVSGAIMIRPMFGYVIPSTIENVQKDNINFNLSPNPVVNSLKINLSKDVDAEYKIFDIQGRAVLGGTVNSDVFIDVSNLQTGIYIIKLYDNSKLIGTPQKLLKQ